MNGVLDSKMTASSSRGSHYKEHGPEKARMSSIENSGEF